MLYPNRRQISKRRETVPAYSGQEPPEDLADRVSVSRDGFEQKYGIASSMIDSLAQVLSNMPATTKRATQIQWARSIVDGWSALMKHIEKYYFNSAPSIMENLATGSDLQRLAIAQITDRIMWERVQWSAYLKALKECFVDSEPLSPSNAAKVLSAVCQNLIVMAAAAFPAGVERERSGMEAIVLKKANAAALQEERDRIVAENKARKNAEKKEAQEAKRQAAERAAEEAKQRQWLEDEQIDLSLLEVPPIDIAETSPATYEAVEEMNARILGVREGGWKRSERMELRDTFSSIIDDLEIFLANRWTGKEQERMKLDLKEVRRSFADALPSNVQDKAPSRVWGDFTKSWKKILERLGQISKQ